MPRTISTDVSNAVGNDVVSIYYAVTLMFFNPSSNATVPFRVWTGNTQKTIEGNNFVGAGDLLAISQIEEASDLKASGIQVSLSGVNSTLITYAMTYHYHGRDVFVDMGMGSSSDTTNLFTGYMDQLIINDSEASSTISVKCESKLIDLDRIRPFRYTEETQQSLVSGDTFFSLVQDLQDKSFNWGRDT